jgi:1-acyl-sn-glycerol-3-phosphate acyltransferase
MSANDTDKPASVRISMRWARHLKDLAITLLLWAYFTAGFIVFFAPFYLFAFVFAPDRPAAFQRLNSCFYRGFFFLCRLVIPRQKWDISPEVRSIRSSVIVSNHLSYLDSILLVSLFPRHTTIAKARLFDIPLFGRMLALSGYIPSSGEGPYAALLVNSLDTMSSHLEKGGNIVVFPEGTRSRNGRVGPLQKGIFKIAKYCQAPIEVVGIQNTEKLFEPGKFLFTTCRPHTIRVTRIAQLPPGDASGAFSTKALMAQVGELLDEHATKGFL